MDELIEKLNEWADREPHRFWELARWNSRRAEVVLFDDELFENGWLKFEAESIEDALDEAASSHDATH